jgi:hypothetical protein
MHRESSATATSRAAAGGRNSPAVHRIFTTIRLGCAVAAKERPKSIHPRLGDIV